MPDAFAAIVRSLVSLTSFDYRLVNRDRALERYDKDLRAAARSLSAASARR
jgi:hypothetical protein